MAAGESVIYTRVYLSSSPRQLISGQGPEGGRLSPVELIDEFINHSDAHSEEPTALVSVSSRIADTVKRAFDKYDENNDNSGDIWIVFIEVPTASAGTDVQVHPAEQVAQEAGHWKPILFRFEHLFERAIPEEFVLHRVSLETLMARGLDRRDYIEAAEYPDHSPKGMARLRHVMENDFSSQDPWEMSMQLVSFARKFGARAPVPWIAFRFCWDCGPRRDPDIVSDLDFLSDLNNWIDTGLGDWLSDIEYKEFERWRADMEAEMEIEADWDRIDFFEAWYRVDDDGTVGILEHEQDLARAAKVDMLLRRQNRREEVLEIIEAEAVRIGL